MNLLYVACVLITFALVENIQVPIAPDLVKSFVVETPPEVGSVHFVEPSIIWVVPVRFGVVAFTADTSPPAASTSAAAT